MHIFIGADHGGFLLKEELKKMLAEKSDQVFSHQPEVHDVGAFTHDPTDDYPQFGQAVAGKVAQSAPILDQDPENWGVLICRSGGGMAIAANRTPKIRAVVCRTIQDVDHARRHNNANVIVLEGDHIGPDAAWQCLQTFITTPFEGGRHTRRVQALA